MTILATLYNNDDLEYFRNRCNILERENRQLREENRQLREEIAAIKETVSALVARNICAKPGRQNDTKKRSKPGRKNGHEGTTRKRPDHIDAKVLVDTEDCARCGTKLSKPTDSYTRIVEDIIPARVIVTEYTIVRRYCRNCKKQVSPIIPYVLTNERFGLRLMLLIVSLKLLGLSYEKITGLFKLLFNLDVTEASIEHAVMKVSEAFGARYNELVDELMKERNIHGDETSWRVNGKNHWLWTFVGKWTVIYEIDRSRGKDVPARMLKDYHGNITSDSWSAWNHVGNTHQRCHYHYVRDIDDTLKYKNPGKEFKRFAKKLKRILYDSQKADRESKKRLEAKKRFEKRIEQLISEPYKDSHCIRFVKRLRREKNMLFTFLEMDGVKFHNNDAERAIRQCVIIRKITYGNKSEDGAKALTRLMSIRETCVKRGVNFYNYALEYLNNSKRTS